MMLCNDCGQPLHAWNEASDIAALVGHSLVPEELVVQVAGGVFDISRRRLTPLRVRCDIRNGGFQDACLPKLEAVTVDLSGSRFHRAGLPQSVFHCVDLRGASFARANLRGGRFLRCDLRGASFRGADLRGCRFDKAELEGADLRGCKLSTGTSFVAAKLEGCRIDRFTAEFLARNGVSRASLLLMQVEDDVGTLRLSFAGPSRTLHVLGIVAFVAPYVWFMAQKSIAGLSACGAEGVECHPLSSALWEEVLRGGVFSAVTLTLLLVYNSARSALILKSLSLTHYETTTGIPARFELRGWWRPLYAARWLVGVNIAMVALHLWHLMDNPVPK